MINITEAKMGTLVCTEHRLPRMQMSVSTVMAEGEECSDPKGNEETLVLPFSSQSYRLTVPQLDDLSQQENAVSQSWRPDVWHPVSRAALSTLSRKGPAFVHPVLLKPGVPVHFPSL